jgi:hypothetical protein
MPVASSNQYDWKAGLSLQAVSSPSKEQLMQCINQAEPLSNMGGVIFMDGSVNYPGVAANSRFSRYLWLDTDGGGVPALKVQDQDESGQSYAHWKSIGLSADAVTYEHLADGAATVYDSTETTEKIHALEGGGVSTKATQALRINAAGTKVEAVPIATLLSTSSTPVTALIGGADNYFLRMDSSTPQWESVTFEDEINDLGLKLSKLNSDGVSTGWLLRCTAAGGVEKMDNDDSVSGFLPNYSIHPDKVATGGATTDDLLRFNGTKWVPYTPNIGILSTAEIATTGVTDSAVLSQGRELLTSHGLGARPKMVRAVIVCGIAEHSFGVGDEIDVVGCYGTNGADADGRSVFAVLATTTQISVTYRNIVAGANLRTIDKGGATEVNLTLANWTMKVYAW